MAPPPRTVPRRIRDSIHAQPAKMAMTLRQRLVVGAIGGITPVMINLVAVDLPTTLQTMTMLDIVGYVLRGLILCSIGAGIAYLNTTEKDRMKLYQMGIAAPAIITAMINGSTIVRNHPVTYQPTLTLPSTSTPQAPTVHDGYPATLPAGSTAIPATTRPGPHTAMTSDRHGALSYFISGADAAPLMPPLPELVPFSTNQQPSATSQIWRGFSGAQDYRNWYVIVGAYPNLQAAQDIANRINSDPRLPPGFNAYYYAPSPFPNAPGVSLVIGQGFDSDQAQYIQFTAQRFGFAPFIYVWHP